MYMYQPYKKRAFTWEKLCVLTFVKHASQSHLEFDLDFVVNFDAEKS